MTAEHPKTAPTDDRIEVDARCLEVMDGVISGDRAALGELYRRFVDQLVERAERRIPERHRGRIMAESVVHSVMESLLDLETGDRARLSQYRITNWGQLYGLLARMTLCKCVNRVRKWEATKRGADAAGVLDPAIVMSRGPSPEDEQTYSELLGKLFDPLQPPELEVLDLRMAGFTHEEIASQTRLTVTTVKAIVRRLQRRLQRVLAEDGEE